jgi:hypothetical protein
MTFSDFLFALNGLALVLLAMAVTAALANWQDAREDRRRAQRAVSGE